MILRALLSLGRAQSLCMLSLVVLCKFVYFQQRRELAQMKLGPNDTHCKQVAEGLRNSPKTTAASAFDFLYQKYLFLIEMAKI